MLNLLFTASVKKFLGTAIALLAVIFLVSQVLPPLDKSQGAREKYEQAGKYLANNELDKAEKYFRRAYKDEPENYNYLWQLAKTQARLEKYDNAVQSYDELILKIPGKPLPYIEQGEVYELLNDFEKAKSLYSKAVEIDKNAVTAYLNWSTLLLRQNNRPEAKFILEEGLRNNPGQEELIKAYHRLQ